MIYVCLSFEETGEIEHENYPMATPPVILLILPRHETEKGRELFPVPFVMCAWHVVELGGGSPLSARQGERLARGQGCRSQGRI